jgi:ssDNA-binding Zn-finger/Zn-ribbon topoisomerase 1
MSFKCSVFGHRFGDPEVERDREEQGSEVVITITETETCQRCGETRVVSENKEVTTLETPSDIVGDDLADEDDENEAAADQADEAEPVDTVETAGSGETPAPATTDDAELIDEGEDAIGSEDDDAAAEPAAETPDIAAAEAEDPAESEETDPAAWPGEDGTDDDEDDAVILDGTDDEDDREPGQWPDEADDDEEEESDDWAPDTGQELRPVEEEQPDVQPTSDAVTVPEGSFYCPECEFTTDVESSSLREGDFCPECHRGTLTHQPDEA